MNEVTPTIPAPVPPPREPLKAYGPDGTITAVSYDSGKHWSPAAVKDAPTPAPRTYQYRIAAVVPPQGLIPSFERRIITSFAPLGDAGIMAAWGPQEKILELEDNAFDGIVLPFGALFGTTEEIVAQMTALKRVGPKLFVDIDAGQLKGTQMATLLAMVQLADAVLVPNDAIAQQIRKHNVQVFTVPPTVNTQVWHGVKRVPGSIQDKVRIAVQTNGDPVLEQAVAWAQEHWSAKAEFVVDQGPERSIYDDPGFYTKIDVLLVGAPNQRIQVTGAGIIPAMMAGCSICADSLYNRIITHGHSGTIIARGQGSWRKAITHEITDRRHRLAMQAGARNRARHFQGRLVLGRLAMPYRVTFR